MPADTGFIPAAYMRRNLYALAIMVMIFTVLIGCSLLSVDSTKDKEGKTKETLSKSQDKSKVEQEKKISGEMKKIILYFGNDTADWLVAEERDVKLNNGDKLEKVIMEELIKGPNKDLSITIPKETKLLSIDTKDGICTVDLSREIIEKHPGGSAGEIMTLDSIVNSLTEVEYIKKVQILIEGAKREAFIHMEIGQPLERDESMIKK